MDRVRVAALQFAAAPDVDENLATCLRLIDEAVRLHAPALVVLPELCNHTSWYVDREHAQRVALTLEGPFLAAIAERARTHGVHVALSVSLQRDPERLTVTSLLYGVSGELLAEADKQNIVGHESPYFHRAEQVSPVVQTAFGRIGLASGGDALSMETVRSLALRGAQLVCCGSSSFAYDDAALHLPARAAESRLFLVSANLVGPLASEAAVESASILSIPTESLSGVGESQIVGPDGAVLVRAEGPAECIVVADLDLATADHKLRADGTHLFELRRPDLYRPLTARPRGSLMEPAVEALEVAVVCELDAGSVDSALTSAVQFIGNLACEGAELIVLPELFYLPGGRVEHPAAASDLFTTVVRAVSEALTNTGAHVVTSVVERIGSELFHMGVVIGARGIVARQPQLHVPLRHAWATPGRRCDTFRLPWGRLALAVGEDLCVPEIIKVYALAGAQLIAAPGAVQEAWELGLGARARAAENRVCMAVATRGGSEFASALYDLEPEFSLSLPFRDRVFEGRCNEPRMTSCMAGQAVLRMPLRISAANEKELFDGAHLLDRRAWWLHADLTRRGLGVPEQEQTDQPGEEDASEQPAHQPSAADEQATDSGDESHQQPDQGAQVEPSRPADEQAAATYAEGEQAAGERVAAEEPDAAQAAVEGAEPEPGADLASPDLQSEGASESPEADNKSDAG